MDSIFPRYTVDLYKSKDDDIEYIHPQYVKWRFIRHSDGSIEEIKAKFDGMDIDTFCDIKTKELREIALKNFESYSLDEHIVTVAYDKIYWSHIYNFNKENTWITKIKGLSEIIWGFKHDEVCDRINKNNFRDEIRIYNENNPRPRIENFDFQK